jgi:hypothetical protein
MTLTLQIKGTKKDGTIQNIYPERIDGEQSDQEIENVAVGWRKLKETFQQPCYSPFTSISFWMDGKQTETVQIIQVQEEAFHGVSLEMQFQIKDLYQSKGKGSIFMKEGSESGEYTTLTWLEEQARQDEAGDIDPFESLIDALRLYDPTTQYILTIAPADEGALDISVFEYA